MNNTELVCENKSLESIYSLAKNLEDNLEESVLRIMSKLSDVKAYPYTRYANCKVPSSGETPKLSEPMRREMVSDIHDSLKILKKFTLELEEVCDHIDQIKG